MSEKADERTYIVSDDGKTITCLRCGKISHNANDVREHYCGHCHIFHDDLNWEAEQQR